MNLPEESKYEQPPAGTHTAICIAFIDLGTQPNEYLGETKYTHQVMLRWELVGELMDDGRPFTVGQFYTWSMNDKAKLRLHLEAWRGAPFQRDDLGMNGKFNTKNLLAKPCTLGVIHNEKGNARVSSVGAKLKNVEVSDPVNELIYVALTMTDFDPSQLGKLSEKMQDMVKRSPEYRELQGQKPVENFTADLDDEIPF